MAQKQKIDPFEIGKWALLIGGVYAGYQILKKLGIIKTGAEAQAENLSSEQQGQADLLNLTITEKDYTNVNFYKKPAPKGYVVALMPKQATDYLAKQIWDSYGSWYSDDNEEQMQGAIKTLRYNTMYSFLADRFYSLYNEDLTLFLKEHFSTNELYPVWSYLNSLPAYKKK